ncbi:MAG TPA: YbhB/YbcL family Raf kinase inhibitor-like protein [Candidatus Saccharimonadales bacterium]|nr:YbhB/YbcL family Raf kinase inhibitor-like protein [Candidatus Saccharimonadales bacterium]
MQINSSKFNNTQQIPSIYTCKGQNINPPLTFLNVPPQAKSLALIVNDPDSPSGNFIHWVIWNIPTDSTILEGSTPKNATQGRNDFGNVGYGGPCPRNGTHRYVFNLFALDSNISLTSDAGEPELKKAIENHILDSSTLTGMFSA